MCLTARHPVRYRARHRPPRQACRQRVRRRGRAYHCALRCASFQRQLLPTCSPAVIHVQLYVQLGVRMISRQALRCRCLPQQSHSVDVWMRAVRCVHLMPVLASSSALIRAMCCARVLQGMILRSTRRCRCRCRAQLRTCLFIQLRLRRQDPACRCVSRQCARLLRQLLPTCGRAVIHAPCCVQVAPIMR